jgi:hypothetical protein
MLKEEVDKPDFYLILLCNKFEIIKYSKCFVTFQFNSAKRKN